MVPVGSGWGIFFLPNPKFGLVGLVQNFSQPNPTQPSIFGLGSGWVRVGLSNFFFLSFIYPPSIVNPNTILNKIY